jgi:hypothetical protein
LAFTGLPYDYLDSYCSYFALAATDDTTADATDDDTISAAVYHYVASGDKNCCFANGARASRTTNADANYCSCLSSHYSTYCCCSSPLRLSAD